MANDPDEAAPVLNDDEVDPILEARLEHGLAPYRDLLPPEDLEVFREMLTLFLTTHPVAVRLLNRLRARPAPASSGEVLGRDPGALAELSKMPANGKRRNVR
jgi:hypothetical protein